MKKLYIILAISSLPLIANSQVFWHENFGTGCNQGQLASSFTGTNGAWSLSSTGTNDPYANTFFIGAQEAGNAVGACGSACTGTIDASLHVGNVAITSPITVPADNGASYNSGGLCGGFSICVITNRRAESPTINCTGKSSIMLSCAYMENGATTLDDASLWYSADGSTFTLLDNMAKTPLGACSPQGTWTAYSFLLPASADNNPNVKIGFNWTNNDDGAGTDPSFAVDDIKLSEDSTLSTDEFVAASLNIFSSGNMITVQSNETVKLMGVYDVISKNIPSSLVNNTINLEGKPSGIYFVSVEVKGQVYTRKIFIR